VLFYGVFFAPDAEKHPETRLNRACFCFRAACRQIKRTGMHGYRSQKKSQDTLFINKEFSACLEGAFFFSRYIDKNFDCSDRAACC
jgi:hypothetical protein